MSGSCRALAWPADAGDVAAGQQAVPVQGLEGQLAEVVQAGRPQQREAERAGVMPAQRLGVVVEVDEQRPGWYTWASSRSTTTISAASGRYARRSRFASSVPPVPPPG